MAPNQRSEIVMSEAEVARFLEQSRVATMATVGHDGLPHLVAMWFGLVDGRIYFETKAKSQKAVNLRRDPRIVVSVEAGDTYDQLRGVMLKCAAAIHRDPEVVAGVGTELAARYSGGGHVTPAQAAKRVALQFVVKEIASFDHRKLG